MLLKSGGSVDRVQECCGTVRQQTEQSVAGVIGDLDDFWRRVISRLNKCHHKR